MAKSDKLTRIHLPSFTHKDDKFTESTGTVRHRSESIITLDGPMLAWFIKGAHKQHMDDKQLHGHDHVPIDEVIFLGDLHSAYISVELEDTGVVERNYTRYAIKLLQKWLLRLMKHYEELQDREDMDNPTSKQYDDYISMKLLLVDLKEWLLGEIVELEEADYRDPDEADRYPE